MRTIEVIEGQKFGRLTIISCLPIHKRVGKQKSLRIFYKCKCECGSIREYRKDYLIKGSTKSCGCARAERAIRIGKEKRTENGYMKWIYGNWKRNAKSRNLVFKLSFQEVCNLANGSCHYCGSMPIIRETRTNDIVGIKVPVNSIDRIDSEKGYEIDNVVPSCVRCNIMKSSMSKEEFVEHISKVYQFLRDHWNESLPN